jgi:hypothetical protein
VQVDQVWHLVERRTGGNAQPGLEAVHEPRFQQPLEINVFLGIYVGRQRERISLALVHQTGVIDRDRIPVLVGGEARRRRGLGDRGEVFFRRRVDTRLGRGHDEVIAIMSVGKTGLLRTHEMSFSVDREWSPHWRGIFEAPESTLEQRGVVRPSLVSCRLL